MTLPHLVAIAAAGLLASAAPAPAPAPSSGTGLARRKTAPLYTILVSPTHRRIPTRVPAVQQYFDQGLRLSYGFNHAEAICSFKRAAALDPAWPWLLGHRARLWSPLNSPIDSASGSAAYAEHRRRGPLHAPRPARVHRGGRPALRGGPARRPEQLDPAYRERWASCPKPTPPPRRRVPLCRISWISVHGIIGSPMARPTRALLRSSASSGGSSPATPTIPPPATTTSMLSRRWTRRPPCPAPSASRASMPGEGHMVACRRTSISESGAGMTPVKGQNQHAIHTDEVFIEGQQPKGADPLAYYPHNIHFLAFASTMAGQSAQAIEASKTLTSKVNVDVARQVGMLEEMLPYHTLTLTTFGKWHDALAQRLPPADIRFPYAMAYDARGVAHAARAGLLRGAGRARHRHRNQYRHA